MTVPNAISLARLATVPVFVWLFASEREEAAVLIYAVAASSDWLDGYIARRTGSVTELGKLLDPLADRIFIAALVIALLVRGALPAWLALTIILRDALVLVFFGVVDRGSGTRIRVNFVGKTATASLLIGLTLMALGETSLRLAANPNEVGFVFVALGAALYWVSGAMYARVAMRARDRARAGRP